MKTFLIGYDLNRPRGTNDYPKLIEAIKSFDSWWHYLDSTWIIKSSSTSSQIEEKLAAFVDLGDEILVVRLKREAAWQGFDKEASDWLKNYLSED